MPSPDSKSRLLSVRLRPTPLVDESAPPPSPPPGAIVAPPRVSRSILQRDTKAPPEVEPIEGGRLARFEDAVVAFDTREQYVRQITALWRRAQSAFIQIGRYLDLAKDRLPHGEYWAMIERDLPFSPRTAHQIRAAAHAVTSGKLPQDRLPASYTTIYLLSTLDAAALRVAEAQGLLRPNLRRAEVVAFKRSIGGGEESGDDLTAVRAARERLLRERERIEKELARLEARLAEANGRSVIDGEVGTDSAA